MVAGKVHTGDTHTDFQLLVQKTQVDGTNVVVDLSAFTTKQIISVSYTHLTLPTTPYV